MMISPMLTVRHSGVTRRCSPAIAVTNVSIVMLGYLAMPPTVSMTIKTRKKSGPSSRYETAAAQETQYPWPCT
jgi:hypothetical protein